MAHRDEINVFLKFSFYFLFFFTAVDNHLHDVLCKSSFTLVLMPVLGQEYLA